MHDADYLERLEFLAILMLQNPRAQMRKLKREALKLYPLHSATMQRWWLTSTHVSDQACDLVTAMMARPQ